MMKDSKTKLPNPPIFKQSLYDFTLQDLRHRLTPVFRANQVFYWLYSRYVENFSQMKNLPKNLICSLEEGFAIRTLKIVRVEESRDGTKKYLFRTQDGYTFESVFLRMKEEKYDESGRLIHSDKYTFCLSSQIGCSVGCTFCFTAKGGFLRDLSAGEIVEQVVWLKQDNSLPPQKRINLVFMGMGEPLNNLENVAQAIRIFSSPEGLGISPRRQTISTSGIAPQIKALGDLDLGVQLAISLHAVDDKLRDRLMPINKSYNIQSILEVLKFFPMRTGRRIMFEYLMIKDVNDDLASAKKLLKLLNGFKAKVNLILFNPHEGSKFQRPSLEKARVFADFLVNKGLLTTIRESKGVDISAACGQLRERQIKNFLPHPKHPTISPEAVVLSQK